MSHLNLAIFKVSLKTTTKIFIDIYRQIFISNFFIFSHDYKCLLFFNGDWIVIEIN